MKIDGKFYYSVNIPGRHGYSFAVCSENELNDEEVISKAYDAGAFEDQEDDVDYAVVDTAFDENDMKQFADCTYNV
jgi:hypothetical protein